MSLEKTKKEKIAKARANLRDRSQPGLKKYPCKRNKGEHLFELKKTKIYWSCETLNRYCSFGIEENKECLEPFKKKKTTFEEWRCKFCNKKETKLIKVRI